MGQVVEFRPQASEPVAEASVKRITMDDGHTRIAHGLLEELMQAKYKLSGREYAVLMVVIRKTYGYMKSEDWIALSQFETMTGIAKSNCIKIIRALVDRKILLRRANGNDQMLSINVNINEWLVESSSKKAAASRVKAKKAAQSNSTTSASNLTTFASDSTTSASNSTPTIDKYKNNILKDSVPTHVETTPVDHSNLDNPVVEVNEMVCQEERVDSEPHPVQPKRKSRKPTLNFTPEDRAFAEYMAERIDAVNGLSDKRRNLDNWANVLRLMRQVDERSPEDIAMVFNWANQDHFWQSNIQSPEKLRKQFIRLYGECRKSNHFGASSHENHRATGQQHSSQQEYINDISWLDEC